MVAIVKHDLDFILRQIKIAEAHSKGTPLAEIRIDANGNVTNDPTALLAVPTTLSPYGLRTVDGSYNNLMAGRDQWGAADNPFPQITDPYWRNEGDDAQMFGTPANPVRLDNNNYTPGSQPGNPMFRPGTVADADPRIISNLIVDQTLKNPAAIYAALVHSGHSGAELQTALDAIIAAHNAIAPSTAASSTAALAALAAQATANTKQAAATAAQNAAEMAQATAAAAQEDYDAAVAAGAGSSGDLEALFTAAEEAAADADAAEATALTAAANATAAATIAADAQTGATTARAAAEMASAECPGSDWRWRRGRRGWFSWRGLSVEVVSAYEGVR